MLWQNCSVATIWLFFGIVFLHGHCRMTGTARLAWKVASSAMPGFRGRRHGAGAPESPPRDSLIGMLACCS
ncbi:uncharacterized protein B0I36DRAFT_326007 [Microdochium trichocladiopsis]|uniref:Uncharacterized protein n=1 Tax=Microdochium trichocladiopsis TaxID=1682393 RepID=A0A9P9BPR8_9PEZI|nr:uncharacterized protein B0I36DRAFT_326007 [Microdochium trichocladiopsis]KAH7029559.1 hypothetical protein B0I36DRAFT_326007 [Microdochium trichocladiopsis]